MVRSSILVVPVLAGLMMAAFPGDARAQFPKKMKITVGNPFDGGLLEKNRLGRTPNSIRQFDPNGSRPPVPPTPPPASTTFRPGSYQGVGGGMGYNPTTGSFHAPGVGVVKNSGLYTPIGNGYYRNSMTGNVYNPQTGSYSQGKNTSFAPGGYQQIGNVRHNPVTGATHLPGQAVIKNSGVYQPIGGGYYQNPATGNIYNPYTRAYKSR